MKNKMFYQFCQMFYNTRKACFQELILEKKKKPSVITAPVFTEKSKNIKWHFVCFVVVSLFAFFRTETISLFTTDDSHVFRNKLF